MSLPSVHENRCRTSIIVSVFQVPGLFEGDEYTTLMTQCKEGSQRDGLMLDSSEELYKWFTEQVRTSLSWDVDPSLNNS
jgi:dynein heavy chain 1